VKEAYLVSGVLDQYFGCACVGWGVSYIDLYYIHSCIVCFMMFSSFTFSSFFIGSVCTLVLR
jgi:hypothetical protein